MKFLNLSTLLLPILCWLCAVEATASTRMLVLGVAQDAGLPQAGCYQPHCMPAWLDANQERGATSLAVINDLSHQIFLFEATPDFPRQLYKLNQVAPTGQYSLSGIFLSHAHIGHYAGLMYLGHEAMGASNVPVYAMPRMAKFLANNAPWSQLLDFKNIDLHELENQRTEKFGGIKVTPFLVPHRDEFSETVGYKIEGPRKTALFIPDINKWNVWKQDLVALVKSVDYAFLDASFYADGELPGRDMSKIPHPLVTETMDELDELSQEQRNKVWFIHMNHTNPLLSDKSDAYSLVNAAGFNVTKEGMEFGL